MPPISEEPSEPSPQALPEPLVDVKHDPIPPEMPLEKPIVKPLEEHSNQTIPKKKGYMVTILRSERVKSFCPKVGAIAGFILGFLIINYLSNFQNFKNFSQQTQTGELKHFAQKIAPSSNERYDNDFAYPTPPPGLDQAKIAKLRGQLKELQDGARKNQAILNTVGQNAVKASALGPIDHVKTALSYVQVVALRHVPINIFSNESYMGACMGACIGACIGSILIHRVARWLDK